jgi:hypothetical protein
MALLIDTRVWFTIDGNPVRMDGDWSCDMVAPGGYNRFTGSCDPDGLPWIGQGSILTAYRAPFDVLWQGRLSQPPRRYDGSLRLVASGPKAVMEGTQGIFPEQIRDYGAWSQSGADGYGYAQDNSIILSSQDGQFGWQVTDNTTIGANDEAGYVLWRPGWPVGRIAYTVTAAGPSGSRTLQYTENLATSGAAKDQSWATTDDLIEVALRRIGGGGVTNGNFWVNLKLVRVNYQASGDEMTASQGLVDLGGYLAFDTTRIVPSAANVLPQDWQGGAFDQLAYQLAAYEDYCVIVIEDLGLAAAKDPTGFQMVAGPWGGDDGGPFHSWTIGTDVGLQSPDLEDLEMANEIVVSYLTAAGTQTQLVLDADPSIDPLINPTTGRRTVIAHYEDITSAGPQQDDTLPSSVASNLLASYISPKLRGPFVVGALEGPEGALHSPYELQAGDTGYLRDEDPALPPQRVVSVEYRPNGGVTGTASQDISAARLLANAAAAASRSI